MERAEITAIGMVQGVGFRYFVYTNAVELDLKGYTKNLYSGDEVLTVVEGEKAFIEELFKRIRTGPRYASVNKCLINWQPYKNEFKTFEIRH